MVNLSFNWYFHYIMTSFKCILLWCSVDFHSDKCPRCEAYLRISSISHTFINPYFFSQVSSTLCRTCLVHRIKILELHEIHQQSSKKEGTYQISFLWEFSPFPYRQTALHIIVKFLTKSSCCNSCIQDLWCLGTCAHHCQNNLQCKKKKIWWNKWLYLSSLQKVEWSVVVLGPLYSAWSNP